MMGPARNELTPEEEMPSPWPPICSLVNQHTSKEDIPKAKTENRSSYGWEGHKYLLQAAFTYCYAYSVFKRLYYNPKK